jgi:ABC-2 type transport system permease protein
MNHAIPMTVRHVRELLREPAWIGITLTTPVIWLLLFGSLFERAVDIPGFGSTDYTDFFTPGVVVMTAFFSAGWGGMSMIQDIDRGVIDRFLATPVKRSALIVGRVGQAALTIAIQSLIIVVLALIVGGSFANGPLGVLGMIAIGMLLGLTIGALSNGLALVVRKEETLIGAINVLLFPLTFISTAFMPGDLIPGWMETAAEFNPVNWAVEAARIAAQGDDWSQLAIYVGALVALALVCIGFATRAFRAYQRSL